MAWTDLSEQVHGITPTSRVFHGFSSADGVLYVHGGYAGPYLNDGYYEYILLDDLHSFDPAAKVWTNLAAPAGGIAPTARYSHCFTTADGKLYVHGGCASDACPANDLHVYDPVAMAWTELYAYASPSPRFSHGFTAAGGRLYVHGGEGIDGETQTLYCVFRNVRLMLLLSFYILLRSDVNYEVWILSGGLIQDMLAIIFPQNIAPAFVGLGWPWLVYVFDWDLIALSDTATASLSAEINLCYEYFPCVLQLGGEPHGTVEVFGNGRLLCLSSAGCTQISIRAVAFDCSSNNKSLFTMQGSALIVSNSSFTGCHTDSDGGVVQAYDMAKVDIEGCHFDHTYTTGFGGAVAAYGSNLSISASTFHNCSARNGGGALWIHAFQVCAPCYGESATTLTYNTQLWITSSVFSHCTTPGSGGAVLADSNSLGGEVLDVTVLHSQFSLCSAEAEGGALRISGASVVAQLHFTEINSCVSQASGGAASSSGLSSLSLVGCSLYNNTAQGAGGGAVQLNLSYFSSYNTTISNNRAPSGGGGALFWQGWVKPATIECPEGMTWSNASSCASDTAYASECQLAICVPCSAGAFQSAMGALECTACFAGSYSEILGASECNSCSAGTYTSLKGATSSSVCVFCGPGTYSDVPGSSVCRSCPAGTYSSDEAANSSHTCLGCVAGSYSSLDGAKNSLVCVLCDEGTYSDIPGSTRCTICPSERCFDSGTNSSASSGSRPKSGTRMSVSFDSSSASANAQFDSVLALPSEEENSISYRWKQTPKRGKEDSGNRALLLLCSLEQKQILEVLASVSITTFAGIKRFLTMLMLEKDASSPKEAIQSVLDGGMHSSKSIIKATKRAASVNENRPQRPIRSAPSKKQRRAQAARGSTPTNILGISPPSGLDGLYGEMNSARYGPFIASDYKELEVSRMAELVYTGLPFNFTVTKKDAYGNTILSDSSSVLEAMSSLANGIADPRTYIVGSAVSRLSEGVAWFQFAVEASFSMIDYNRQNTSLYAPIFLSLASEGVDAESGVKMESGQVPLNVQDGSSVCPAGFILVSDKSNEASGPAVCDLCKPNTYSISPLALLPGSSVPSCVQCPAGCQCTGGGTDIHCEIGSWKSVDGVYRVTSCPAGFQLINSTAGTSKGQFSSDQQQCKACLPGQYIINPDVDACQDCPPGHHPRFINSHLCDK